MTRPQSHDDGKGFTPPVLSRELSKMSDYDLRKAVDSFQDVISHYCGRLAEELYFNPRLQESLFARLQAARKEIAEAKDSNLLVTLNNVIFELHRVHAKIEQELELITRSKSLRWITPVLAVGYMVIIVGVILKWKSSLESTVIPLIGIPPGVLLWSLIGSVAAILHRFYSYRIGELSQVNLEVTWLLARPLTGVIMGMASYLFIVAGLLVFGNAATAEIRPQLLWAVAFLAGFSDKFFEGLIYRLVRTLSGGQESSPGLDKAHKALAR